MHPALFCDRSARPYRVSFRIAEEATWDHRFHDLDGQEIATGTLDLDQRDHRLIQASCDGAVGSATIKDLTQPHFERLSSPSPAASIASLG